MDGNLVIAACFGLTAAAVRAIGQAAGQTALLVSARRIRRSPISRRPFAAASGRMPQAWANSGRAAALAPPGAGQAWHACC
ncbi:hypothetical protein [Roseicella frigidaeris]|nr:hypothetical protein [Roseicella frigidaeris]